VNPLTSTGCTSVDNCVSVNLELVDKFCYLGGVLSVDGDADARPRGRPKKTWREIVEKDCQARKLNREDAMDRNRWRKQIRDD